MREALDHWDFVIAAYAVGMGGLAVLAGWSWQAMRRAEQARDKARRKESGR